MPKDFPTISHDEAKRLIAAGKKLTPAGLYEPEHARQAKFVFILFPDKTKRFYRIREGVPK